MPTYRSTKRHSLRSRSDLLVVGVTSPNRLTDQAKEVDKALGGALRSHIAKTRTLGWAGRVFFKGEPRHATVFPTMGRIGASEVMVVGLGDKEGLNAERVRRAAGAAARHAAGYANVTLDISSGIDGGAQAAVEGFELGSYIFDRYITSPVRKTDSVTVVGADDQEIERGRIYADATRWARDLISESPSRRGPAEFAEAAAARAQAAGVKAQIFDEQQLAKMGMNGILTVGRGSASPPRLLVLSYSPRGAKSFVGLVGKGITFDSGGLSLKTAQGMETMKMDCTGAASVAAAITALAELGAKTKVVAAIALAENMPGGRATKPGDVIVHYGGHTSEVLNTDAEGRLVLADALAWMCEREPDAIVDVATLTGGMMVALGLKVAGFFSTDELLASQLMASSARTGEPLWQMPIVDDYREVLDSPVADIKNSAGTTYGSPIYGALFLKDFVAQVPWAHIDIAGPAWAEKPDHYLPVGPTAFATRLLLDWLENRA